MTARCGGGTSSGRPLYGRFVYMGPAQIGAALNNIPTPWAVAFAGVLGSITYDLTTFCTTDPPADPGMTAEDWVALLNPYTLTDSVLARSKFRDWIGHYLWDQLCQCDSGLVPTPYPPPPAPTNLPVLNPPSVAPAYPIGQPCANYDFGTVHLTGTTSGPFHNFPIGAITYASMDIIERSRPTASPDDIAFNLDWLNAAGTRIGGTAVGLNTSFDTLHAEQAVPTGTASYRLYYSVTVGLSGPIDVHTTVNLYCGGNTPGGSSGSPPVPCPADPFTQMMLDQILQLVTLIQRQKVPFATVTQSTHPAVTGSGSIAVSGAIGARIVVTGIPPGSSIYEGDVDAMYDIGWINWTGPSGVTPRSWIEVSPMLSMPEGAGTFTGLSYTLTPGAAVTIEILSREP
jgi:hypothetical protein